MTENNKIYTGERALFSASDMSIKGAVFEDGESPLKHSRDIELSDTVFRWKYPLWYSENIKADNCVFFETARAGIWYTKNIHIRNTMIEAPKLFRRCKGVVIEGSVFSEAAETLWECEDVRLCDISAKGDYFAMNSRDMTHSGMRARRISFL